jgi:hypothetical protein
MIFPFALGFIIDCDNLIIDIAIYIYIYIYIFKKDMYYVIIPYFTTMIYAVKDSNSYSAW